MFTHFHQWFICSNTSWRDSLPDRCSPIFLSMVIMCPKWRWTHSLDECSPFLLVVLICSNTRDGLTTWMGFHRSCQWFWSAQTLKRNSQPGCQWAFIHSCQWFWSAQTLEINSHTGWVFTNSYQWFWSAQTLEDRHQENSKMLSHAYLYLFALVLKIRSFFSYLGLKFIR